MKSPDLPPVHNPILSPRSPAPSSDVLVVVLTIALVVLAAMFLSWGTSGLFHG